MLAENLGELVELGLGGQLAPVEEIHGFLEGAVLDELIDGVSEVEEFTFRASDI